MKYAEMTIGALIVRKIQILGEIKKFQSVGDRNIVLLKKEQLEFVNKHLNSKLASQNGSSMGV